MPSFCAVVNCSKRAERDQVRFFRIPAVLKGRGERLDALSKQRRECWVRSLKRGDLSETYLKNARICSNHFLTGEPAQLDDKDNPDWIPTRNMGYESLNTKDQGAVHRHFRITQRTKRLRMDEPHTTQENMESSVNGPSSSMVRRKVCHKHFSETDILHETSAVDWKTGKTITAPLSIPKLKNGAIPCLFPNWPYLSKSSDQHQREAPTPKKNRIEAAAMQAAIKVEQDMENYWQYRVMGKVKTVKLKAGVVPHIFECQQSKQGITPKWENASKRKTMLLVKETSKTVSTLTSGAGTVAIAEQEDLTTTELQRDSEPAEQRSEPISTVVLLPETTECIATKSTPTPDRSREKIYCRLCLKPTNKNSSTALCVDDFNYPGRSHSFKKKKLDEVQEILKMLKFCLPFFDSLTFNPVLCFVCQGRLKHFYTFANDCLKNQRLIEKYVDSHGTTERIVNIEEIIETKFECSDEKKSSPTQTETPTLDSSKHLKNSARNRSRRQIKSKKCLDKDNIVVKKRKICHESQDEDSLTSSNEETLYIKIEPDTDDKSALKEFLEYDILGKEVVDPNNISEEEIIKIEPSFIDYPDLIKTEVEDDVHVKNELCNERTGTGTNIDLEGQHSHFCETDVSLDKTNIFSFAGEPVYLNVNSNVGAITQDVIK